ncbi:MULTISPECIES: glycosyltransferase family 4 protein [Flavobacteriaceae]|uniref:glycosyltransferase family 4 protein n=1 Tax=Flavobacteriaceae TaxID=49546 RepID=UPI001C5F520E|nr:MULTISPECIES: glycosyltransferase family 4 protein [Flavobacteriaceae]MBW4971267.1 glycosyltransferase family 4 protein [Croceibacter atlanticus]MCD9621057.1 glycosyltransferase family 4 protein [Tenacibaculum maritimum]MCD9627247.1 glycosyltransferase family 4 protein [Tenacibaculum maritimum]MCD9631045.1 glycosyltransferase family 4 protein [Tenacibaculum maritimum]MCD9633325.1 glycosyltransferase family 4 protein [Tenacibaculum maritimum]
MRTIIELKKRLKTETSFRRKYPDCKESDDTVHLLYVSPCLNDTGYYRAITPALELNKTASHTAIITKIETFDFNKRFEDYENLIDEQLLYWADYIIFPVIFSDVDFFIKAIRVLRPDVQLVMDVDQNYTAIPQSHAMSRKIGTRDKEQLLSNMISMDIVTTATKPLSNFYKKLLLENFPNHTTHVVQLPSLVSRLGYEEIPPLKRNESEIVRIGILGSKSQLSDLLVLKELVAKTKEVLKEGVQFVFYGWDGKDNQGELVLKGLAVEYHKPVAFENHFKTLNDLALDIVLLPSEKHRFSQCGPYTRLLESAVFGIPAISSVYHPAKQVLKEGETGLLAETTEDWVKSIIRLVNDKELREQMGKNALKSIWMEQHFTSRQLQVFQDLFI